jgi:hypothetical protein
MEKINTVTEQPCLFSFCKVISALLAPKKRIFAHKLKNFPLAATRKLPPDRQFPNKINVSLDFNSIFFYQETN